MTNAPTPLEPHEADAAIRLIASEQARPEGLISYVDVTEAGVRSDLDALEPAWRDTARVVRAGREIVAIAIGEWGGDVPRVWVHGPWAASDAAWDAHAGAVLDAVLGQVPEAIVEAEMSGEIANVRLAQLATARGWEPGVVNYALAARASTTVGWAYDEDLVDLSFEHQSRLAALHGLEFPGAYMSAAEIADGVFEGDLVAFVAEGTGREFLGYAAGQVQASGDGYIDFVAVEPAARGRGIGARLVQTLGRELVLRSRTARVCLTVQAPRAAARALYDQLGFETEVALVGYRGRLTS